jgi:hypothetical protein
MVYFTWKFILLYIYIIINFLFGLKIYRNYQKFIKDKFIIDSKTNREISFHEFYPEFKKDGNVTFLRIFFGLIFFFWIKLITSLSLAFTLGVWLM